MEAKSQSKCFLGKTGGDTYSFLLEARKEFCIDTRSGRGEWETSPKSGRGSSSKGGLLSISLVGDRRPITVGEAANLFVSSRTIKGPHDNKCTEQSEVREGRAIQITQLSL